MKTQRTRYDRLAEVTPRLEEAQEVSDKPAGLWYSVNGDWERWCRDESTGWLNKKHVHDLKLGDEKILKINSVEKLDYFHMGNRVLLGGLSWYIDWPKVSKKYDGIEISPYLWERRLMGQASRWYYTWDCASGCIWRPKGVKLKRVSFYEAT